jgi:translation initiation factor IF-1
MATHQKKHIKRVSGNKELQVKQNEFEQYGEIISEKGDLRFEVKVIKTGVLALAKARQAIAKGPKKTRIIKGDIVLLQLDEATTGRDKYFIIHKYSPDDVKQLRKAGELSIIAGEEDDEVKIAFEEEAVVAAQNVVDVDDAFIADL